MYLYINILNHNMDINIDFPIENNGRIYDSKALKKAFEEYKIEPNILSNQETGETQILSFDFVLDNIKTIENKVLDFIKDFKKGAMGITNKFLNGYCFWFAYILDSWCDMNEIKSQHRIMYNQVLGHFACEINGELYDITGKLDRKSEYFSKWMPWADWYIQEPEYRKIVVRDCILKEKPEE